MALEKFKYMTLKEFYHMREISNELMEFIDGTVYMSPSPSTKHQRISGRLYVELFNYLEGKGCEVFDAPFDIVLHKEDIEEDKIVIPDLSVIGDKSGLNEQNYKGVPTLIVEILSPSNQSHDLVLKLNLYMQYGVKEYWIVNPMLDSIQVYSLDENGGYIQKDNKVSKGVINSKVLEGFKVDVEKIFG
ncbi:Uma2 family endonuclease [Clostridium bovifaecis]|uniref:Uma2 family endonuclease n=1 Tax=Clostridium bovifaecis TaxID=2184719 RepID=A0A6I6EL51_9CLOT|nr:Uma2 family endonuclease [Clostridium bovifaecis]